MVLAETMSYYIGGLVLAALAGGLGGLRHCLRPARYVAFLPASAAFSASNFLTYVAVRGLGASQFYLLVQLRVAVLAVFARFSSGVRQPVITWFSLCQLAAGMFVLVYYQANVGADCGILGSEVAGHLRGSITGNGTQSGDSDRTSASALAEAVVEAAADAAERA